MQIKTTSLTMWPSKNYFDDFHKNVNKFLATTKWDVKAEIFT